MAILRARGILDIIRTKTASVVSRANAMTTGWGNNATVFVTPNPTIQVIDGQVVIVNKAETLAQTRAKGSAGARNVQRSILVGMLEADLTYIQGIADNASTPEQAANILQLGGVVVAAVGQHAKQILTVTQAQPGGLVLLDAFARVLKNGAKSAFFNWQSTSDGGKTFVNLPSTPKSKTTAAGFTPLTTVGFRVCFTGPTAIPGEWSQIVSFLVH